MTPSSPKKKEPNVEMQAQTLEQSQERSAVTLYPRQKPSAAQEQKVVRLGRRECPGRGKGVGGRQILHPQLEGGLDAWKTHHQGRERHWRTGRGLQSDPEQHHSWGSWARILRVALGKHNLRTREAAQQVLRVVRQVPHPQYNSRTHDNDLMLLQLERAARLGRTARPIAVASSCASPGTPCRVSGWGTISSPIGEEGGEAGGLSPGSGGGGGRTESGMEEA